MKQVLARIRRLSEETRAKISAARKGHVTSQETRSKISSSLRGRPLTGARRLKNAEALRSPERRAKISAAVTKHGRWNTPEYRTWQAMIARCERPSKENFARYGGRGIRVCDEWRHDFSAFLAHIGPKPGPEYSIDRIDVNGNYAPGNVRWATAKEQARNRRSPRRQAAETVPI